MKRIILTLVALTLAQMSLLAQLPVITNQPPSRTVWAGSDVTLSVGASGTGVSTYQWLLNGVALPTALVKVVAGGGTNYPADGGAATNADVEPVGIAADASGNLFVSDGILVRKIDRDGIITTIAGGGTNYPGDGLPATGVSLSPTAIAVDTMGDLYLAGGPLLGHFRGVRSGHATNRQLLAQLFADRSAWRFTTLAVPGAAEEAWEEAMPQRARA